MSIPKLRHWPISWAVVTTIAQRSPPVAPGHVATDFRQRVMICHVFPFALMGLALVQSSSPGASGKCFPMNSCRLMVVKSTAKYDSKWFQKGALSIDSKSCCASTPLQIIHRKASTISSQLLLLHIPHQNHIVASRADPITSIKVSSVDLVDLGKKSSFAKHRNNPGQT